MPLFQQSVLKKYIHDLDKLQLQSAWHLFSAHFLDPVKQENIRNLKEEEYQEGFVRDLFVNVLGYTLNPQPHFNFVLEKKTVTDATKSDGAILHNGEVIAVIELKDTGTADLDKVSTQAFGYKHKHKNCVYVITSNFEKLRFYINDATDYEEFNLFNLSQERFALLYLCLQQKKLQDNVPLQLKQNSVTQEENITKQLYAGYSSFKRTLFQNIAAHNTQYDKLLLFKKTQKLLDRFLFIFFAEDRMLLPPNSVREILKQWEQLKELDNYVPLYDRFKKYFGYLNLGHAGKQYEIFAYNGGLFVPDEILENIIIDDAILYDGTMMLSHYDFETDVDVNILGHIFEHSLTEIEELQAELEGTAIEKKTTRRKKDGVFYTPRYITKYIVENTVGALCIQQKAVLQIDEETFAPGKRKDKRKTLLDKIEAYREWLLQITICDPACGSGAFLIAALEYLKEEHRNMDELKARIFGDAIVYSDIDNSILENNLFGVDINEEAVEIAKLSLWLHTAKKGRKLSNLSNNIKCGNSLIDNAAVAGDKAFAWNKEFSQVFEEKDKRAFHITTATHDSRTSERMIKFKVREKRANGTRPKADPEWLTNDEELLVTKVVSEIVTEDQLNVMAYNICADHMHLLLVCEEEEISKIMQKIKSKTGRAVNIERGVTIPTEASEHAGDGSITTEHVPLLTKNTSGVTQHSLWTQKFGCKEIMDEAQLWNTVEYIRTNREKHRLPPLVESNSPTIEKETYPVTKEQGRMLPCLYQEYDYVFRKEYKGGFDVVIGNPPYGAMFNFKEKKEIILKFKTYKYKFESYIYFFEKGINIINEKGYLGYITPELWLNLESFEPLRNFILNHAKLLEINVVGENVFEGAIVNTLMTIITKQPQFSKFQVKYKEQDWELSYIEWKNTQNKAIEYRISKKAFGIINKVQNNSFDLNEIGSVIQGITPYDKYRGHDSELIKRRGFHFSYKKDETCGKWLSGEDINRYKYDWGGEWLSYGDWLGAAREPKFFEGNRILFREIPGTNRRIQSAIISELAYYGHSITPFILNDKQDINLLKKLLCLINSTLMSWYGSIKLPNFGKEIFPKLNPQDIKLLPIHTEIKEGGNNLIAKADTMLSKNKELNQLSQEFVHLLEAKNSGININKKLQNWYALTGNEFLKELAKQKIKLLLSEQQEWLQYFEEQKVKANNIQQIISQTDAEIDAMVYELYHLTEEEIKTVEEK